MGTQLSSEQISQLAPLLGSLARLIAGHGEIADEQLQLLLAVTDLDSHPVALVEIKLWSRLLSRAQIAPSPALRQTIVESLLMCGLPEASVLLAVATVVGSGTDAIQTTAASPARLQASVTHLDFGILRPGQGAVLDLEVQGGPGHVIVESDQIQVTPPQFGTGSTRLWVELRPLTSGLIWTTIKLVTAGETREVPVTAQWQDGDTAPAKLLLNPLIQSPQPSAATPPPQQNPRQPQPLIQQPPPPATVVPQPARQLMLEVPVVPIMPPASVLVPPPARFSTWMFLLIPLLIILVVGNFLINGMIQQARQAQEESQMATAMVHQATADAQAVTRTASERQTTLTVAATTATELAQLTETALAQAATETALTQAATETALAQLTETAQAAIETALAQAAIETALAQAATETALAHTAVEATTVASEHPTVIITTFSTVLPNGGHLYRLPSRDPGMALGLIWPGDEVLCLGEEFENGNGRWIYVRVVKASLDRGSGGVPEGTEGYARATLISTP